LSVRLQPKPSKAKPGWLYQLDYSPSQAKQSQAGCNQLDYSPSQAKQSQAGCKSTTALPIPDLPDPDLPDPDPDLLSTIIGPLQMLISNSFLNQSRSNFGFYIS